jgi:tetrahydromethanopterin S-methyltransferase subunit G
MSDEVSLRDHVEALIKGQREYFDSRLDGIEKATALFNENTNTKFAGQNEWRDQSNDEKATFMTRSEGNALDGKIETMQNELAELRGKASQKSLNLVTGLAVISIIISIIAILI